MKKHSSRPKKFRKPRPDFPLFPHRSGHWAKKVRGESKYFGRCDEDPKGEKALLLWLEQKDDLLAGRTPRSKAGGLEVGTLCNEFLNAKAQALKTGEIAAVTFNDYRATTDRIVDAFGKRRLVSDLRASDFSEVRQKMSETLGHVALGNAVQRVRSVFKFGFDEQLFPTPMAFGSVFKPPSKKVKRKQRNERAPRLFEPAELKELIEASGPAMRAMILLGANAAMGNSDIAHLPIRALDLDGGWLNFPRPKTGVRRRVPLWKETVDALRKVLAKRPKPKSPDDAEIVFITKYGHRWDKPGKFTGEIIAGDPEQEPVEGERKKAKTIASNKAISKEFKKLARARGSDRTFYDLRHTFRTVAGGAKDVEATMSIMGHAHDHVEDNYIETVEEDRLQAVVAHVRDWLFPDPVKAKKPATKTPGKKKTDEVSPGLRIVG